MKFKIFFLPVLFLAITSCSNNDDNCKDKIINTTSLESEYQCTNTKNDLDVELTEDFIVIRDQTDFNSRVAGNCNPDIDFSIFDLVIGKKKLTTGNDSIEYELTENCEAGKYVLNVTFNQNESTVAPNLTYHRLIPKMAQGKELTVVTDIN